MTTSLLRTPTTRAQWRAAARSALRVVHVPTAQCGILLAVSGMGGVALVRLDDNSAGQKNHPYYDRFPLSEVQAEVAEN